MDDQITDYISIKGKERRMDIQTVDNFANYISNHITVHRGLLLSYSPTKDYLLNIPERFYRLAKELGVGLLGLHALAIMCYERWQKRPLNIGTKKSESYSNMGVSAIVTKTPQWEHLSEGFQEIQLLDYP